MDVIVEGWRASPADWQAASREPADQLPPLSEAQREVARKLHIPEEDYARSAFAGKRTQAALLEKAQRFARLLDARVKKLREAASVSTVVLRTIDHRFDVEISDGKKLLPLRIDENIVDDLLEGGSADADRRVSGMLEQAFAIGDVW